MASVRTLLIHVSFRPRDVYYDECDRRGIRVLNVDPAPIFNEHGPFLQKQSKLMALARKAYRAFENNIEVISTDFWPDRTAQVEGLYQVQTGNITATDLQLWAKTEITEWKKVLSPNTQIALVIDANNDPDMNRAVGEQVKKGSKCLAENQMKTYLELINNMKPTADLEYCALFRAPLGQSQAEVLDSALKML